MFVEPELAKYFTLVNHKELSCIVWQNRQAALIIIEID